MRYTLRLLTMDQSDRLVRMVQGMNMAWERAGEGGTFHPFTVGFWVGRKATPNKMKEAQDALLALARGDEVKEGRVIMFEACPWCGSKEMAEHACWDIDESRPTFALRGRCPAEGCVFNSEEGIPFSCIDEDLYLHPPTVLLGTSDKFVQAAWNRHVENDSDASIRRMLGYTRDGPRAPDLIIQDELHLLSGPLGSMAGLLETAFDVGSRRPETVMLRNTSQRPPPSEVQRGTWR